MKKGFIGIYHPSVVLTCAGLGFTVAGIGAAFSGGISAAMILLVLAALCDMFDGVVARRFKRTDREKAFGIQIDSIVDVCSFCVFPVCLLFQLAGQGIVTCVVAILYAIGAVERLAWFNITTEENPDRFVGLPVIYSALVLPLVYLLGLYLPAAVMPWLWRGSYLLMAVLFVTGFETKKPSLAFRLWMLLVAVGIIVALCVLP